MAAAPTRDTGEREGAAKPPLEAEGRWDAFTVASTEEEGTQLEEEAFSVGGEEALSVRGEEAF